MSFRAPKGTDDILPPDSRRWRTLLRSWDILAEQYGYAYVATPIFEATELFARGMGEATEVVEKQMYNFRDKAGRRLTLRPEITAGVVRAYIQGGRSGEFKGAYSGPAFRYERPQEGRRRQFWQVGVEYLGASDAEADLEVIELGYRFLLDCGLGDVVVQVNSIGDPADRLAYHRILGDWLEERREMLSEDARRRIRSNPLRVLDSKADREVVADAPVPVDHLGAATAAHYHQVIEGLGERGIEHRQDPRLVRGLDYYNRTVFEYIPPSYQAAQNAVGGGGRYDGLTRILGGLRRSGSRRRPRTRPDPGRGGKPPRGPGARCVPRGGGPGPSQSGPRLRPPAALSRCPLRPGGRTAVGEGAVPGRQPPGRGRRRGHRKRVGCRSGHGQGSEFRRRAPDAGRRGGGLGDG